MNNEEFLDLTRLEYVSNWIPGAIRAVCRKIQGRNSFSMKRYNGSPILNGEKANIHFQKCLDNDQPFLVARFGDGELRAVVYYIEKKLGFRKSYPDYIKVVLERNAGFFPASEENIDKFGQLMIESCKQVDVLAVWFNFLEDFVYRKFGPQNGICVYPSALEPFWYPNPWSTALEGKKVLVIHPFEETIKKQYNENRQRLYHDNNVLPVFTLHTLKAVQSLGGCSNEFDNWFDALDYMYQKAMTIDFEIAIIGCGAYGFPLAAKLKQSGKKVIHMGGVTQFLFGIKGGRWDSRPDYAAFYNDYWVRPLESEKPKSADQVENGCYW